jgi:hypothetical protein
MQSYELSPAALRALNVMREDYSFTDGPQFLDDVLDVLNQLHHLSRAERRLRQELRRIPPVARASISGAIRAARTKPARD